MDDTAWRVISELSIPDVAWERSPLIALFGLPCTGKTEVARFLVSRLPLISVSTDEIRLRYGLASGPATHAVIFEVASHLLPRKIGIVWDGIHPARANRDQIRAFARDHAASLELIYTTATQEIIHKRLDERIRAAEQTAREGKFVISPAHFERIASYLEPPEPIEDVLTVDTTDGEIAGQLEPVLERIRMLRI